MRFGGLILRRGQEGFGPRNLRFSRVVCFTQRFCVLVGRSGALKWREGKVIHLGTVGLVSTFFSRVLAGRQQRRVGVTGNA